MNYDYNSPLDEYTVKLKITEKLSSIAQKNSFLKSKLLNGNQMEINETQIINNLNDVSALLSQVSSLLTQLKSIIQSKANDNYTDGTNDYDDKLELLYQFNMNQYKREQSAFIANQAAFDSLVSSLQYISPKAEEMLEEEEVGVDDSAFNEDQSKFALHKANTQSQINDIYEKTIVINQISRDINMISHGQEGKLESIESNLHNTRSDIQKGNKEIVSKCKEKSMRSQTNVYVALLISLFCVFVVLVYSQFIKK